MAITYKCNARCKNGAGIYLSRGRTRWGFAGWQKKGEDGKDINVEKRKEGLGKENEERNLYPFVDSSA
jgi:hypothetical protein